MLWVDVCMYMCGAAMCELREGCVHTVRHGGVHILSIDRADQVQGLPVSRPDEESADVGEGRGTQSLFMAGGGDLPVPGLSNSSRFGIQEMQGKSELL